MFHPTTLDGLFQLIVPALSQGGNRWLPTMVPSRIASLWISVNGLLDPKSAPLDASARCRFKGYHQAESAITAIFSETGSAAFILKRLESTSVTNNRMSDTATEEERHLCCSLDWKPDLDLMTLDQILHYCESTRP